MAQKPKAKKPAKPKDRGEHMVEAAQDLEALKKLWRNADKSVHALFGKWLKTPAAQKGKKVL